MAAPSAPSNAVAVHIGQGSVLISFDQSSGEVLYYEVYASETLNGVYKPYMNGRFKLPRGVLHNVPIGATAYFRVRAVNADGASSFVQVYRGVVAKPNTLMNVTAVKGSTIPEGAIFAVADEGGRIIAYSATEDITIA